MARLLEADRLTRIYGVAAAAVPALRGVDLAVGAGEYVAVMGPSGCGKSTLLHLLGGLDRPTSGAVRIDGRRVDGLSERAWARLRRRQIGFVFQLFNLIPNLSVSENIELPAALAGVPRREARRRRDELLERLDLQDKAGVAPGDLSGGGRQRVAIARALVNRPPLVLADEPTGSLDSHATRDVTSLLRGLRDEGHAIVLVTHDARVAATADRVVSMRDGLLVDDTLLHDDPRPVSDVLGLEA